MSEKPILFNGEMVRAILKDLKTQTRRPCKLTSGCHVKDPRGHRRWHPADPDAVIASPYGQPGDRLWVRETWAETVNVGERPEPWPDRPHKRIYEGEDEPLDCVIWAADGHWQWLDEYGGDTNKSYWKPSIHMPRWASRIDLLVKRVWIERLQEISTNDIIAEGFSTTLREYDAYCRSIELFLHSWDAIYEKKGFGWDANPWVWCCEFERIDKAMKGGVSDA